ncbi:MBOAT family O-acyltransferase [Rhodopirellula sp. MGV]|uniref:MBOAT family O-acyltransferase n=1 Tax=Rhodopirellula sp. MGV TaxID=2023130 RepID=UPI000B975567|nr:MBOAT family protein [Rhodopirellula sp. MGV]OYP37340.1 alginate O-acetyltransferase [Rhodopirellula sp. MGV]PNY36429.1 MBOAT family protein [Rhodopirellula baltica]
MQFTITEFFIFFAVVLVAVWQLRTRLQRNVLLLVASYYFYAYWDYRFCGLLLLSTIVDFVAGRQIELATSQQQRRRWLALSLCVNLGSLGFFKYCNFFIESAQALLAPIGFDVSTLEIVLPVGISFYTFQTLSYTIDIYRGKLRASDSLVDFALYVAFFPQLVAGPIVRAAELLPQLAVVPAWSSRRAYGGFQTVLRGLVKKVLIADRLGEFVDVVFAGPDLYSGATVWLAVIAYAGQIYYDFSGYSDIAIGLAKLLGYRFPKNFRHPYLALSPAQFWRRWHMTLSRWLRDYLYIPLGGNRMGERRTSLNLLATMTLGGLWHGAAWTFVLWGVWHGMVLCVERSFASHTPWRVWRSIRWASTMGIVMFGWILFRCDSLKQVAEVLGQLAFLHTGILWLPPLALVAMALMLAEYAVWMSRYRLMMRLPADRFYSAVATTVMIWCLILYAPRGFTPFVYFQF